MSDWIDPYQRKIHYITVTQRDIDFCVNSQYNISPYWYAVCKQYTLKPDTSIKLFTPVAVQETRWRLDKKFKPGKYRLQFIYP